MSVASFANIFSHPVGCLFTFSIVFFEAQILNFDEVQFVYSIVCAFAVISKKPLPNPRTYRFTIVFF